MKLAEIEARLDNLEDRLSEYTATTETLQQVVEYLTRELNKYKNDN